MTTRRLVLIHQHQPPNPHTTKKGAQQATQPQAASTHQYLTHHTRSKPCPTTVSVVHSDGETPGPIPNPEAKPARADGTAPGRVWESRLPPTQQLQTPTRSNPHPGAAPRFFVSTPTPNATPTIQRPHTALQTMWPPPTHLVAGWGGRCVRRPRIAHNPGHTNQPAG